MNETKPARSERRVSRAIVCSVYNTHLMEVVLVQLSDKAREIRMLEHAGESDEHTIRAKWEEWEEAVERLMWEEVCLSFLLSS